MWYILWTQAVKFLNFFKYKSFLDKIERLKTMFTDSFFLNEKEIKIQK